MAVEAHGILSNRLWAWWRRTVIAEVDHEDVVRRVAEESGWSARYCFMILISAAMSILGLLLPSSAVLIGAMLISPLMMPIVGLGFGLATFDFIEVRRAAFALALGSVIAILFSAIFVMMSPLQTVTAEIAMRTRPNLFDLLVAILSALAGAYGLIRGMGSTVVGVAIAIALMPPLAVVGFGMATWNWTAAGGAALLFFTNLIAMAATIALFVRLYGFGAHLSPKQTQLQGFVLTAVMIALAVPLGVALHKIAWETVASRQIRDAVLTPFPNGSRISQIDIDYTGTPVIVRAVVLTPALSEQASAQAARAAQRLTGRPIDLRVDQVLVGNRPGAGESAQLARAQAGEDRRRLGADLRDRIALLAGVAPESIVMDETGKRAAVTMAALPGASIETYHALVERATRGLEGWSLAFTPPPAALPQIAIADEAPDEAGARALTAAIWAARRLRLPVGVSGGNAEARETVIAAFAEVGVTARDEGAALGDAIRLQWLAPDAPGA
ncbi:MAG: DUF389 domain-containing protein [Sphingomonas sp.]|nr:DUF389 domain-containing protein [Sphingomonas sp.]